MNLIFKDITKDNWEQCIKLKVNKEQENFVASNSYSILESKFTKGLYPLAIYDDETMVGFLMYEIDDIAKDVGMCRLMIDEKYQGKGYGKSAVLKLIEFVKENYSPTPFLTSFEPTNSVAKKLYESCGFKDTGELFDNEMLYKIDL